MTANYKGMKINYTVSGEGEPVLLLHGWGSSIIVWNRIINAFSNKYKIFALDFPGCGESDLPKNPLTIDDYLDLVLWFMSEQNIESPILMGHSHGGRVILKLLCENKVNAKKVVLFDSAGIVTKKSFSTRAKIKTFKAVKKVLSLPLIKNNDELINKARGFFGSADYNAAPEVMRKTLVNVVSVDLTDKLSNINCPVLLIWGENDTDTTLEAAKILEKGIKDSGLCVLKDCGHFAIIEKPYDVNAILNSFLG